MMTVYFCALCVPAIRSEAATIPSPQADSSDRIYVSGVDLGIFAPYFNSSSNSVYVYNSSNNIVASTTPFVVNYPGDGLGSPYYAGSTGASRIVYSVSMQNLEELKSLYPDAIFNMRATVSFYSSVATSWSGSVVKTTPSGTQSIPITFSANSSNVEFGSFDLDISDAISLFFRVTCNVSPNLSSVGVALTVVGANYSASEPEPDVLLQIRDSINTTNDILDNRLPEIRDSVDAVNDSLNDFFNNDEASSKLDQSNSELSAILDQYDKDTDTSSYFEQIPDDFFTVDESLWFQVASTSSFFGSIISMLWDKLGDFSAPLLLMLVVTLASTFIGMFSFQRVSSYHGVPKGLESKSRSSYFPSSSPRIGRK